MDNLERVHVIVCTYNGEKYIREQLDSIIQNTYGNISIEISDDGSTDGTIAIANEYKERYGEQITIHVPEKNQGYVKNFLNALKRSDAPYTMFCDQDDIWMKDKIQVTYDKMKEMEKETQNVPILVFTDALLYNGETGDEMGSFHKNSHLDTSRLDLAHLLMENKCIGCTIMLNQKIQEYLQEMPETIRVHDWWLALICASFGKIGYINRCTLKYRQHSGNMIGGSSFGNYFMRRIRALKEQKKAIYLSVSQGQSFYEIFQSKLGDDKKEIAAAFAQLPEVNWFKKRNICLHYGFMKTGASRNIGLLLLL